MATVAPSQPVQPARSLLRLVNPKSGDDGTLYEAVCECDGSFCGAHQGACENTRFLNPNSFHRALACKQCTQAHGGLVLRESARRPTGQIAQNLFTGRRSGRGPDYPQAKALAAHVAPEEKERKAYLDWLWIRAQNLLNESSSKAAIETLAKTLRSEPEVRGLRTIPARQAKTIIEEVLGAEHDGGS